MKRCNKHINIEVIWDNGMKECPLCASYEDSKFYTGCIQTYENLIRLTLDKMYESGSGPKEKIDSLEKLLQFMEDYMAGRLSKEELDHYYMREGV